MRNDAIARGSRGLPARAGLLPAFVLVLALWPISLRADAPEDVQIDWKLLEDRVEAGRPVTVFGEAKRTPGRPAFRIETILDARPAVAAAELRAEMLSETDVPRGQTRRVLESKDNQWVVHTYLDLPLMLADREVALRLVSSLEPETGTHRIVWDDANDVLPPAASGVVRLRGTRGYWLFSPTDDGQTRAVYQSQTEIGGSFPVAIGDRLMKGQAIEAVSRLRGRIERRRKTHVASDAPNKR